MLKPLRRHHSRVVHANPYWRHVVDTYERPDGSTGDYHLADSRGSVLILPRDDAGRFMLVRQQRYLAQMVGLEFPGGGLEPDQAPIEGAAEELRQEAGLRAGSLTLLGRFYPCKGLTNEVCRVYLATALSQTDAEPGVSEAFEWVWMTPEAIDAALTSGALWDGMTIAAWALYLRSPQARDADA